MRLSRVTSVVLSLAAVAAACSSSAKVSTTTNTTIAPVSSPTTNGGAGFVPEVKCPDRFAPPAQDQRPGTETEVVPATPVTAIACRYPIAGGTAGSGVLASTGPLNAAAARAALNGAEVVTKPADRMCPMIVGDDIIFVFGYSDGSPLNVHMSLSGCRVTTNGNRAVYGPDALQEKLPPSKP